LLFVNAGRRDGTIDVWYAALKVMPENHTAAYQMAILLLQAKRFSEVPPVLEKPIAAAPDKYDLQVLRIRALLRGGHKRGCRRAGKNCCRRNLRSPDLERPCI
jgi:hypothetical protein